MPQDIVIWGSGIAKRQTGLESKPKMELYVYDLMIYSFFSSRYIYSVNFTFLGKVQQYPLICYKPHPAEVC